MKFWEYILQGIRDLLTADSQTSSKRAAGLWLVLIFSVCLLIMVARHNYDLVRDAGILAGSLLGLGILDKIFRDK